MSFYRELAPARALQALLACRWERLVSEQSSSTTLVLPDGCVDLIWRGGDVVVAGPDRRSNPTEVGSGERIIGLRLRPGVAGAVLGLPTSEVLDARLPLVDVLGRGAEAMLLTAGYYAGKAPVLGDLLRRPA